MKKVVLAGFWCAQYIFGIGAIFTMAKAIQLLPPFLLIASYYATIVGGKVLGIGQELQARANEEVPSFIEGLWKITCFIFIAFSALSMAHVSEIGGYRVPFTSWQALIGVYVAAAIRDSFLVRFYFAQEL